jgi:DNA-binding beta-propeller fold protein YncE
MPPAITAKLRATVTASLLAVLAGCSSFLGIPLQGGGSVVLIVSGTVNRLYLMNPDTQQIFGQVVTGQNPAGVAAAPDGHMVLVTNRDDANVSAFWREGWGGFAPLGTVGTGAQPEGIAFNPNPAIAEAYVVSTADAQVTVLDTSGRLAPRVLATIPLVQGDLRPEPHHVAVSPDGQRVFVSDSANGVIFTLMRSAGAAGTIEAKVSPQAPVLKSESDLRGMLAVNNDRLYVANQKGYQLLTFDGPQNKFIGNVSLSDRISSVRAPYVGPVNLAMNPQRTKLFVAGSAASVISEVALSDSGTASFLRNIPIFTGRDDTASSPIGVAVTPDGNYVLATNRSGFNCSLINASPDRQIGSALFKNLEIGSNEPLGQIVVVGKPDGG